MKKYFIALIPALIFPSIAFASFNSSLSYGESSPAVAQLQKLLISQDCLSASATGYFGSLTLAGVKCFQTKYDLPSTGFFGPMSRSVANEIANTAPADGSALVPAAASTTDMVQISCPQGWSCTQQSPADLSQGVASAPGFSTLVGYGTAEATTSADGDINTIDSVTFSPLVGGGSTTVDLATTTTVTSGLSQLVGAGSATTTSY